MVAGAAPPDATARGGTLLAGPRLTAPALSVSPAAETSIEKPS